MIELYTWPTPNGRKISIMLEELNAEYKVIPIDIKNNEQYSKFFSKISPSNKIPAIIDRENKQSIFESGAIMLYLAEKYNKLIDKKNYWEIMQWFYYQISQVGPYFGQAHNYLHYFPGKSKFAEERSKAYVNRVYQTLDDRLSIFDYLGIEYSVADIATWPWVARFEMHKAEIGKYPNVLKWYRRIAKRPAVIKGYNVVGDFCEIPKP
tara:strand:+ start:43 stop:666 length:624 start_codon:yes stop_codon:yes gene_type:complete